MSRYATRHSILPLLLIVMLVPVAAASAQAEPPAFVDRVGTLALDRELDARGSLGGITVDRLGFLYVANFRDAVWRISPEGEVTQLTRSLYGASGNAVDGLGDLYQANFLGNSISRITRTGEVSRFAGGLDGPVGLTFGPDGTLYVCNCRGNTLSRVAPGGTVEPFAESELFACPNGITFGGAGNAHIAFAKGFFYVTKIIANRLVKISPSGEITPLAGTGQPGHDDGPALEATFFRPNSIAATPQGDRLYVNTMIGEYSQPKKSRLTVRTVDLTTLTLVLDEAMAAGGLDAAVAAYERYRADPVRGQETTVGEMIAYGYRHLSGRKVPEALRFFGLNAESYPRVAAAQFHFGEAYRYIGQTETAEEQYRKVLEIEPEHAQAASRLQQLGAAAEQ